MHIMQKGVCAHLAHSQQAMSTHKEGLWEHPLPPPQVHGMKRLGTPSCCAETGGILDLVNLFQVLPPAAGCGWAAGHACF